MMPILPPNAVILQLIPSLQSGGAERTVVDMVKAIVEAGGKAVVASSGGRLVQELEKLGGVHITLPLHSKNPFVMAANMFRLKKIMRAHRVSLVHARSRAPAWSGFLACKFMKTPFITTYHGLYKAKSALKHAYNSVMVKGVVTIANSDFTAKHILETHNVKAQVINRGVDTAVFSPRDTIVHKPLLILPARLTKGKGHIEALQALSLIEPKPTLAFVGEGGLKPMLEAEIARLSLQNHVEFWGHSSDMPQTLSKATLVLAPSTVVESFGRVPIEAGAMGKVCVVSRLGGMAYTVIEGETGFFCEAGNAENLAKTIAYALTQDLSAIGNNARAHIVRDYGLEVMCRKTIEIYADIINNA